METSLEEKVECFGYYQKLKPEERVAMDQNIVEIKYLKKETVFKQRSHATHIMYIKEGLVKLYVEGTNGRNLIMNIAKSGDFIGLSKVYGVDHYDFSAVALRNTTVSILKIDEFRRLLANNSDYASEVMKWYCDNSQFIYNKLAMLGTKQMHGRLSDIIIHLCSPQFKGHSVFSYITRKDIAEMAGMSTESCIRLLTEFKNDGLINMSEKSIEVNNMELMQRLSLIG